MSGSLLGSCRRLTSLFGSKTCEILPETDLKSCTVTAKVSSASGSTTNTAFVFDGTVIMPGKLKSRITTEEETMPILRKPGEHGVPIHPGEFLREDFMKPLGLSANALAMALRVPVTRISEIIRERRSITVETAMRLGQYFGTATEFWINMQKSWELAIADQELLPRIRAEVRPAPRDPKTQELRQKATA